MYQTAVKDLYTPTKSDTVYNDFNQDRHYRLLLDHVLIAV